MNQEAFQSSDRRRRIGIIVVIVLIVFVLLEVGQLGGNTRFYATWIMCGQKPVVSQGPGYLNSGVNHYYEPSPWPGIHLVVNYYCSPLEAEKAGYSANPNQYEFPHLEQNR